MDYLNADGLGIKHFGSQIKAFWGLPHSTKLRAGFFAQDDGGEWFLRVPSGQVWDGTGRINFWGCGF